VLSRRAATAVWAGMRARASTALGGALLVENCSPRHAERVGGGWGGLARHWWGSGGLVGAWWGGCL